MMKSPLFSGRDITSQDPARPEGVRNETVMVSVSVDGVAVRP